MFVVFFVLRTKRFVQFVGIRTAILDEKATAVNMILCYIRELKEGFFPWLNSVVNILVPLVEFYYHDGTHSF